MFLNSISILHILHDPTRILVLELRMAMMMISYRLKTLEFPENCSSLTARFL